MSEMDSPPPPPPAAPPPPPEAPVAESSGVSSEARQWGMFAHLSVLSGFLIPFGNFLGPLIIWQVKKNEMPFVDDQGKEALNFQITMFLLFLLCGLLSLVVIGLLLLPLLVIADIVFTIIAALKANEGVAYRYPFTLRLIK